MRKSLFGEAIERKILRLRKDGEGVPRTHGGYRQKEGGGEYSTERTQTKDSPEVIGTDALWRKCFKVNDLIKKHKNA